VIEPIRLSFEVDGPPDRAFDRTSRVSPEWTIGPGDSPTDSRYGSGMTARWRRSPRVFAALLAALLTGLVPSSVAASGGSLPPPTKVVAAAATTPYTLDLSTRADFVAQTNFVQCVGASMQMMLNIMRPVDDQTAATQLDLQVLARSLSGQRPDGNERKGASVRGWTAGLNELGAGPYRTVGDPDLQSTLKIAARAMLETNRPVGLLVWRGRHAWVMAGFTATADPRLTEDFDVTRVTVMDPLYPYGSKTWGASPRPGESLAVADLARQFVPRGNHGSFPGGASAADQGGTWSEGLTGKYVVVLPYIERLAVRLFRVAH
jgi:hypothetical protein